MAALQGRATLPLYVAAPAPSSDALVAPASHFQRLHVERGERGRITHNIQLQWRLHGPLDMALLRHALELLTARHEPLRSSLRLTPQGAVQVIDARPEVPLTGLELRRRQLPDHARSELARPFELAVAPLFRATIARIGDREHVLLLTASHAIWDGWSSNVAVHELAHVYGALRAREPPRMPPLLLQFADHVAARRRPPSSVVEYWRRHLADYRRTGSPGTASYEPAHSSFTAASAGVLARLDAAARGEGATLGIASIAALCVLLRRSSDEDRVYVAFNDVNRDEPSHRSLIGPFLSFFIVSVRLESDATLATALHRTRDSVLGAYAHRADVDAQLPDASRWGDPRFPVIHDAWINYFPRVGLLAGPARPARAADLSIEPLATRGAADPRWNDGALGLTLVETDAAALDGTVVRDASRLDEASARSVACDYSRILTAMAANPRRSLAALRTEGSAALRNARLV